MIYIKNFKKEVNIYNALCYFSLVAGWPCVFYLMGWLPFYTISYVALFGVCFLVGLKLSFSIPSQIKSIWITQCMCWGGYCLIFGDTSYVTRIFMLTLVVLIVNIQRAKIGIGFVKLYNFWLCLQVVLGTIGFALFIMGILLPLSTFEEMDGRMGLNFGLFTTNTAVEGFIRVAGYFDEPGAFALWGMFALLLNKLFIDNKKVELILGVGLVITLSMAYFIQMAIYLLLFYKNQKKKLIIGVIAAFAVISLAASISSDFNDAIFGRFKYDKTSKSFEGDNRSELMDSCIKIWSVSPIIGVGASNLATNYSKTHGFVGSNPFTPLASDGIIGFCVSWLPLFFIFFKLGKRDPKFRYAAIIIAVGFLQRPYTDTQLLFPLMMYTIIFQGCIKQYEQCRTKENNILI